MRSRARASLFLLPLGLSALLLGCSLDYRTAASGGGTSGESPDTVLYNFTTTSVRGSEPYFRIRAAEAQTFDKKNVTILRNVSFEEYGTDGKLLARGTADRVVYHTDTKNAELTGNLDVYSEQEKARIKTSYLFWNDKNKTLTGKAGVAVSIRKNDGSQIDARGFEADLRTRTIRFSSNVRGTFVEKSAQ